MTTRPSRLPRIIPLFSCLVFAGCGRPQPARHDSAALSTAWQHVGPNDDHDPNNASSTFAGRVNDIAFDPVTDGIIYVAAGRGGLWRTTDGGSTWSVLSDGWQTSATSAVAVTNGNVYVGTGDKFGPVPLYYRGLMVAQAGVWNWTAVTLGNATVIYKIAADPDQAGTLTVATDDGLWRATSTSAFTRVTLPSLCSHTPATRFIDLRYSARDTSGNRSLFALGRSAGGDLWRSADHGATWSRLPTPLSQADQFGSQIATSPSSAQNLYLASLADGTVWWSTSSGGTPYSPTNCQPQNAWQQIALAGPITSDYFAALGVGSSGPTGGQEIVYAGGVTTAQSINGQPFSSNPIVMHADPHAYVVNPRDFTKVLTGDDGGVETLSYVASSGSTNVIPLNANLGVAEVYTVAVSPQDQTQALCGMQDTASAFSAGNLSSWKSTLTGDESVSIIDPTNYNNQFVSLNWFDGDRDLRQTFNGWQTYRSILPNHLAAGDTGFGTFGRTAKLDPLNPSYLFVVTSAYMYRAYVGNPGAAPIWSFALGGQQLAATYVPVNDFAIGSDDERIYTVASDGSVFMSTNQGSSWSNITGTLPSFGTFVLSAVSINPQNVDDVLIGGYFPDQSGGVWRCTAPTANPPVWSRVASPPGGTYSLARDPADPGNQWYVGGDNGVTFTADAGAHWEDITLPRGLPVTSVRDLQVVGNNLYAGTYGRGVWRAPIGCTPLSCPAEGWNCGVVSDGCGGTLNCGTCPSGQTCGANNVCATTCILRCVHGVCFCS